MAHPTLKQIEELLSIHGAAVRAGCTTYAIQSAILRGDLSAVRSGDRILVPAASLEPFVAGHRSAPKRSA